MAQSDLSEYLFLYMATDPVSVPPALTSVLQRAVAFAPVIVESSRMSGCAQVASELAATTQSPLCFDSVWDSRASALSDRGDILRGEGAKVIRIQFTTKCRLQGRREAEDEQQFAARVFNALHTDQRCLRLAIVPADVFHSAVHQLLPQQSLSNLQFASVHLPSLTMKVFSLAEMEGFDLPCTEMRCARKAEMTVSLKEMREKAVELTEIANLQLARAVQGPISALGNCSRAAEDVELVAETNSRLAGLTNKLRSVQLQLSQKASSMQEIYSAHRGWQQVVLTTLLEATAARERAYNEAQALVEQLTSRVERVRKAVEARTKEYDLIEAEVMVLQNSERVKEKPVKVEMAGIGDDGNQYVQIFSRKQYTLSAILYLVSPTGSSYESCYITCGGQKISFPCISYNDYYIQFFNHSSKALSEQFYFSVYPRHYKQSFLYTSLTNIGEAEAHASEGTLVMLRKLAVAWRNPNSDLVGMLVNTVLNNADKGENIVHQLLVAGGCEFYLDYEKSFGT